jgi:hypothetical protein
VIVDREETVWGLFKVAAFGVLGLLVTPVLLLKGGPAAASALVHGHWAPAGALVLSVLICSVGGAAALWLALGTVGRAGASELRVERRYI